MRALDREPDERPLISAAQRDPTHFAELYEQNFDRVYARGLNIRALAAIGCVTSTAGGSITQNSC